MKLACLGGKTMQQIPHEGQERSNSQESFYYPPTKPRRGHYPTTIQVRRKNQWDIGEWFTKCVQGTDIDKRYGLLAAVLLLLFCLGAVFEGSNMSLSAQASTGKSPSAATHVVQIVRPHWQGLNPTATLASKAAAAHTSTHTAGSSPASIN